MARVDESRPHSRSNGHWHFKSHRICKLLLPKPEEGVTYAIQYYCVNQEALNRYFEEFAPALQQRHAAAYGNRAYAFRTVLEVV